MTHTEAMDMYGSDKPDIRFGMKFETFTDDFKDSGFSVFAQAVADGGVVKAMKFTRPNLAEGTAPMSRSEIDDITAVAQAEGAKGLAYIIYENEGPRSPILKFFTGNGTSAFEAALARKSGDMIFFGAGDRKLVNKVLGKVSPRAPRQICPRQQRRALLRMDYRLPDVRTEGRRFVRLRA